MLQMNSYPTHISLLFSMSNQRYKLFKNMSILSPPIRMKVTATFVSNLPLTVFIRNDSIRPEAGLQI